MNEQIQEIRYLVGEAWKGEYNPVTPYGNANVVQDPTGLSVYRSLKPGNVGHPLSDTNWWFCIINLSSIKAESDRIAALNTAIAQDESLRLAAEQLRQQKEAQREAAETQRNEAEQNRIGAEQQRVTNETQRETKEQQRITAEQGRVTAEINRVAAEQARVQAETLRDNAEDERALAETNRAAAEQQRINNEQTRIAQEQQRVIDFNAQMQQQQTAYTNAEAARETAFNEAEQQRDAKVDEKVADITNLQAQLGYFVCDTGASVAAKTIAATGYALTTGGNIRIKMTNANTADNVTLNINNTGAKALFYNGAQASSTNSWEAGEVIEVYYDGSTYQASNAIGGGNLSIIHEIDTTTEYEDEDVAGADAVQVLLNDIERIEELADNLIIKKGDNNHLLDFCDENGNLVFYVDDDFTFHALLSTVSFHLPQVINTYVGDTLQIFYYPTLLSPNYKHLGVNMFVSGDALNCKSLTRYAEYTPASAGTKTMKFNVLDDSLGILASKTVPINVITPASPSSMKNILLVGDSETEGYVNNSRVSPSADDMTTSMRYPYAKELMRILTSSDAASPTAPAGLGLSNIQLIGHLRGDIRHEGYGGRRASWFLGTSSPFYVNGAIDFNAYLAQDTIYSDTSKKGVDYIYILLGANDGVAKSVVGGKLVLDATTYKNGMISLLDKIKSQIIEGSGTYANPNLKVVLLSYVISNPTGGAYHIYGQREYGNGMIQAFAYYQYYLVNNELSAMPDYADFVESVFVSHEVDSENAYAYIDKQVNAYMADTEKEYIENVHPNIIGYKMYGQAVARDILSRI